jgi:membrane-bound metal-dependent hydrolase YbcI (DUF457 family)
VFLEHLLYSAALAVIVGMIFSRTTGRDPSWIIIAVALVPDIDFALERIDRLPGITIPVINHHGDLHNILFLIVFSLLLAMILRWFGIRFIDGLICAAIGIAAHLVEDALVYKPAYPFLWPFSSQDFGLGILQETRNLGVASNTVLLFGLLLLAGAVLVRTLVEGKGWWRVFFHGGRMEHSSE